MIIETNIMRFLGCAVIDEQCVHLLECLGSQAQFIYLKYYHFNSLSLPLINWKDLILDNFKRRRIVEKRTFLGRYDFYLTTFWIARSPS